MHRFFFSKYETKLGIIFFYSIRLKTVIKLLYNVIVIVWIPKYALNLLQCLSRLRSHLKEWSFSKHWRGLKGQFFI